MEYVPFTQVASLIDIRRGDTVTVSSDLLRWMCICREHQDPFDAGRFLDSLADAVGSEGTLLIPVFNWDFCRGVGFNYHQSRSQSGALGNVAVKHPGFRRTKHPIYSFAVWGKDRDLLCGLTNTDSFGDDSPFGYLYRANAKNILISVDYKLTGFFMVHFSEQRAAVPYRMVKHFSGAYTTENGTVHQATYSMFVKDLSIARRVCIGPDMDALLMQRGYYRRQSISGISFDTIELTGAADIMTEDLTRGGGLIFPQL